MATVFHKEEIVFINLTTAHKENKKHLYLMFLLRIRADLSWMRAGIELVFTLKLTNKNSCVWFLGSPPFPSLCVEFFSLPLSSPSSPPPCALCIFNSSDLQEFIHRGQTGPPLRPVSAAEHASPLQPPAGLWSLFGLCPSKYAPDFWWSLSVFQPHPRFVTASAFHACTWTTGRSRASGGHHPWDPSANGIWLCSRVGVIP